LNASTRTRVLLIALFPIGLVNKLPVSPGKSSHTYVVQFVLVLVAQGGSARPSRADSIPAWYSSHP
jgi:hypothetical protein